MNKCRRIWGHWLYVAVLRLDDGEPLIVVSDAKPKQAVRDYGLR